MKIGAVDLASDVLIVAEIGNNHEGDRVLAEELIAAAADAGAQAVKFQTILPDKLVTAAEVDRLVQLRRLVLDEDAFGRLADVAARHGVMFLSTPFYLEAVELLAPLVPAFKIASSDNDWLALLERVAATAKPILLSTGMADAATVGRGVAAVEAVWSDRDIADPGIVLLHCVSSYPTRPEDANLAVIGMLASLGRVVGYSDHTIGIKAAVLAVAAGARVIEKHFTLDKNYSAFRDHALSADPAELSELVAGVREVQVWLGGGEKRLLDCEASVATAARRSAVAARDLRTGERIGPSDVSWLRPGGGIPAGEPEAVIGRTLRTGLAEGERFQRDRLD